MPNKPKKPCSYNGCPNLTDDRYCEMHRKDRQIKYSKYFRIPEHNKLYDYKWRKIRERYIAEHPICDKCRMDGRIIPATDIHHIKPLREGGTHEDSNLQALCHACHSRLTMTEVMHT